MGIRTGPVRRGDGQTPAIGLVHPKFPHNVGATVRAASCYGIGQVWFSGDRVQLIGERRFRLPREERMRGYQDVELRHAEHFFDAFDADTVPVAALHEPRGRGVHRALRPAREAGPGRPGTGEHAA